MSNRASVPQSFAFRQSPGAKRQFNRNNYFTPQLAILFQNLINKYKFVAKHSEYV